MPFTETLSEFFSESDFATAAVFDGSSDVLGIFDRAYVEVQGIATRGPVFRCAEADVPAAIGKTLVIAGTTYTVRNAEPDGTGLTLLQLEAP